MKGLVVGRMVHYRPRGTFAVRAAVVTEVLDKEQGDVHLMVFHPGQSAPESKVPYSEMAFEHTWGWIPVEK